MGNRIKVLDILPLHSSEGREDTIECEIRTVDLGEYGLMEQYETLSYVWGNQTSTLPIFISAQKVDVTTSLYAIMQQIRLPDHKRTLWIDQICIDQMNPAEKAEQVPLMGKIYSNCTRCLVWLGTIPHEKHISLEDAEAAFEIIRYMAAASKASTDADINYRVPSCITTGLPSQESSLAGAMRAMSAISSAENPWWHRVWTVQEASLPKQLLLLWGPIAISWDTICQASACWTGAKGKFPRAVWDFISSPSYLETTKALLIHSLWIQATCQDKPFSLVRRWRHRIATDPRDKIYGLLGLLQTRGSLPSVEECRYDIPAAEVFARLTIDLIINENSLLPLMNDPRLEPEIRTEAVQSWVMDVKSLPLHDTDWYHIYGSPYYNADKGLPPLNLEPLRLAVAEGRYDTLELKGITVDTVKDVHPDSIIVVNSGNNAEKLRFDTLLSWYETAKQSATREPQETFAKLLLGTLIRHVEQQPKRWVTPEDEADVLSFLDSQSVASELRLTIFHQTRNQKFYITEGGRFGLGHLDTRPGDEVWILGGGSVPFTLRPKERDGKKSPSSGIFEGTFVGRTYVQGIMDGEAVPGEDELSERKVLLS
ncbi:HET-domain-containing protein [Aaosphaeria arxii CBS 175.79]|uniref:HET-domain-containing protein n=1 Tax=Aaosphaeria arxii CBS 175.79 TaxID=1450172 RepID=A0A6A5X9G4_9PLEO|nr:HET-domain-containing protein [Aaosphaeria arxii CBS 175.79]KAF2009591.1 HET-domain-containing protein [Aaosphaeria arxii CBS 175.79]